MYRLQTSNSQSTFYSGLVVVLLSLLPLLLLVALKRKRLEAGAWSLRTHRTFPWIIPSSCLCLKQQRLSGIETPWISTLNVSMLCSFWLNYIYLGKKLFLESSLVTHWSYKEPCKSFQTPWSSLLQYEVRHNYKGSEKIVFSLQASYQFCTSADRNFFFLISSGYVWLSVEHKLTFNSKNS